MTRKLHYIKATLGIGLLCASLLFALQASLGTLPIGGDDGQHDGIDQLAEYLNSKALATVIYDRWLDWELDYYMGQWTNKRRVYYPTPEELLAGVLALDELGTRYFVAPADVELRAWLDTLSEADIKLSLDYESAQFVVYEVTL